MDKITGIYCITSPIGKKYIGQSVNIYLRWRQHKNSNSNSYLNDSFKLFGFDNHKFEILLECESDQLNSIEIEFIKLNNSMYPNGLNLTSGGGSKVFFCEESKLKLSKSHLGQKAWNKGKKATDEAKIKMSLAKKGKPSPRKNCKLSEETKNKLRIARLGRKIHTEEFKQRLRQKPGYWLGKKLSDEHRMKLSESHKKISNGI